MKKIILLFCILLYFTGAKAQTLWEALPLKFDQAPSRMYYDSIEQSSYIYSLFSIVNDTTCNIVRVNPNGSHVLMPQTPHTYNICMLRYNDTLFVGGDKGLIYWNGGDWTIVDTSLLVSSMLAYQGKLLVTGSLADPEETSLYSWDGSTWTSNIYGADTLYTGGGAGYLTAEYKGELYIAGNFNNTVDTAIDDIARFDGTRWQSVGGQIDGDALTHITKMLIWKDTLYVSGAFKESLGSPGNAIAQWDGQQWHRMGKGLNQSYPSATDMVVFNDALYVTGFFHDVNGMNPVPQAGKGLAKWDGSKWCTMGTTADLQIVNVGRTKNSLFVMGGFEIINGDTCINIAKWIGGDYTDSCSLAIDDPTALKDHGTLIQTQLSAYPNPTTGTLQISYFNRTTKKLATLKIVDAVGKIVSNSSFKVEQGSNQFSIDMTGMPAGLYLIELRNGEQKSIAKFIKN